MEKKTLERLEEQHRGTGQMMKASSSGSDEQKSWMLKYRSEQDELEQKRRFLDDLEFQLLEVSYLGQFIYLFIYFQLFEMLFN